MDKIRIVFENDHIYAVSEGVAQDVSIECIHAALRALAVVYKRAKEQRCCQLYFDHNGFMHFQDREGVVTKCVVNHVRTIHA